MQVPRFPIFSIGLLALSACGGAQLPASDSADDDNAPICLSGCGSKGVVVDIPDAENLLMTPEGRVFVSGGTNVFEIGANNENYNARPLAENDCNFTGLAQRGNVLYAVCGGDNALYATELDPQPNLEKIHDLNGFALANGMAVGADDCLYIVDGPLSASSLPSPKIARICLESNPFLVSEESIWLELPLNLPNGLVASGNTFYFTDSQLLLPSSRVRKVTLQADGSAGEISTIYTRTSIFDDLSLYGEQLLVTDYLGGSVFSLSLDGELLDESPVQYYSSPSSVLVVGPPLFMAKDILVTEKGLLGDTSSNFGNILSLYRRNAENTNE